MDKVWTENLKVEATNAGGKKEVGEKEKCQKTKPAG
jgi:hypothetical protein